MTRSASRFVGVLGWPLEHTLSPVIHNVAFRAVGLDWTYLAFPVPPERLPDAIAGLRALGSAGANVTMPHKQAVIPLLDDVSGDARAVGAVNTIECLGDRLIGHNTDVDGFREFVSKESGVAVTGTSCVVLGAGGAARAIVRALEELDVGEVSVVARREEAAEEVAGSAHPGFARAAPWESAQAIAEDSGVIVNCTPLGMRGEDVLPGVPFHEGQLVLDLIYQPPTTPLLDNARAAGAVAWGGLGMLVLQAAASFGIWTGQDPPTDVMSAAAVRAIGLTGGAHMPKELEHGA
ncbi:MAG: shikimate dehydrogenase [Actinobacteria bacterium]|nr:shikimate dehydrogenase [Actinomycetota bacterium]